MKLYFNPTSTFIVRSSSREPPPIRFKLPEPTAPFAMHSPERPKCPGSGRLGPRKGPEHPASWTRRIVSLTTRGYIRTLPLAEKGPLKFLYTHRECLFAGTIGIIAAGTTWRFAWL
jgi:hypothetical protein